MSALELFKVLGDESNRPPSPPKHILKKRKPTQAEKAKRYWPGKAPEYADEEDSYSEESSNEEEPQLKPDSEPDRRLSRYSVTQVEEAQDVSERVRRRKAQVETITVYQSEPAKATPKPREESEPRGPDPGGPERRLDRSALRRLALEYRRQEEERMAENAAPEPEEESESSDESEYCEQEQADEGLDVLSKPVFVPKGSRTTEHEKEQLRREEQQRRENERRRLQERRRDTKEMVIKKFREEEEEPEPAEEDLIDDTDNLDEKEEEEVKLRRAMTDEERELDNQKVDKVVVEKGKLRFLQKYYHRGAFFMDKLQDKSEPLYARDFNAPTADDCVDKSLLPKPMRVRRGQYGKQGQVKHTHLKDVDTTQFDAWAGSDRFKLTGTKQVFDRPSRKK